MTQRYGKWVVEKSLGEGGQAHTFLVYEEGDPEKKLRVLKRLKNLDRIVRFRREAETALKLEHPNIVSTLDFDLHAPKPYIVTEYCEGGTLRQQDLKDLSVHTALELFLQICEGAAHAHEQGVVHRDLKPDNIFIRADRTPVVGDFGICFVGDEGERLTLLNEQVGPRNYIAPELEIGSVNVTTRSDVYSLGKVLYWILSGRDLPRERHRELGFTYTKNRTDAFFLYEVLDRCIVEKPDRRIKDASRLCKLVEKTIGKLDMKAHPLDLEAPQICTYCATGHYRPQVADLEKHGTAIDIAKNFGLSQGGSALWMFFVCDHCGNVQLFSLEQFGKKIQWKNLPSK